MKYTKQDFYYTLELALAITVAASMILYGIGKPTQFTNTTVLQKPIVALSNMELMWAFYGHTKTYPIIIGAFEITGALLLLFNKTRLLGAVITTTILCNVIMQDIFYDVNTGALVAAIIYQALIVIIFLLNLKKIMPAIRFYWQQFTLKLPLQKKVILITIAFITAIFLKGLESIATH